jgi:hypothetical protein
MTTKAATRIDWHTPIHAQAETYYTDVSGDGTETPRPAIRAAERGRPRPDHAQGPAGTALTGFPHRRAATLEDLADECFNWVHSIRTPKLVTGSPLCKAEITDEMLAIQLDVAWQQEDDALKARR